MAPFDLFRNIFLNIKSYTLLFMRKNIVPKKNPLFKLFCTLLLRKPCVAGPIRLSSDRFRHCEEPCDFRWLKCVCVSNRGLPRQQTAGRVHCASPPARALCYTVVYTWPYHLGIKTKGQIVSLTCGEFAIPAAGREAPAEGLGHVRSAVQLTQQSDSPV